MRATYFFICCVVGSALYLTFSFYYLSDNTTVIKYPVLLWWSDFISHQETISCANDRKCIVSGSLENINENNLKAILFYGSSLDLKKLPKYNSNQHWALFHEESPKNLPALRSFRLQQLFDITATFSRHSTFPVTFQYLESIDDLTNQELFIDVKEKNRLMKEHDFAPILYIQSACDTPIKRDNYVKELMKHFKIDSYGACLNNKKMPSELITNNGNIEFYSDPLLKLSAKYKFIIAIENAKCDDYVTEKFWRPLKVGAIPIYLGASTIRDFLPNVASAILIDDFPTIELLADHIRTINQDDNLYNSYMNHKLKKQVTNERLNTAFKYRGKFGTVGNYDDVIPAFQCFVCEAVHEKRDIRKNTANVYNCEYPEDESWHYTWKQGEEEAESIP